MLESIKTIVTTFCANPKFYLLTAYIMTSAIIVFLELSKPLIFNHIKNKEVRGSVLAFSSIALCFACVAVFFAVRKVSFTYYVYVALAVSMWCIFEYWLYEFTRLRKVIYKFGSWVLAQIGVHTAKVATGKTKEKITNALYSGAEDSANEVVAEIDKVKKDYKDVELKNL